jgi:tetratricopeptide (TPR) repeat protein
MSVKTTSALSLCLLVALPFSATAAPNAADYIRAGERAYQSGRYLEAADALKKAYALQKHPLLLYNIARAYDQAVETDKALEYYQRYVDSIEGTDPMLMQRSVLSISRLRAAQAQSREQELERKRLEAEAAAARRRADEEAAAKRQAAIRQQELELEVHRERAQRNKVLAYIVGGVGVAGLVTSVVMGGNALSTRDAFKGTTDQTTKLAHAEVARTQAWVADGALLVGIAGVVSAIILYPKGSPPKPKPAAPSAQWVPLLNGVAVQGQF